MHRTRSRGRCLAAIAATSLCCLSLAACGSSKPVPSSSTQGKSSSLKSLAPAAQNHVYDEALAKYAGCLRKHGVNVANPSPSQGGDASLDMKGIDKSSKRFKRAAEACTSTLDEALRTAAAKAYAPEGSGSKD